MDILSLSMAETLEQYKQKNIKPSEVAQCYWDRAQKLNPKLNAWITFNEDFLAQALKADEKINDVDWSKTPLWAVPLGVKDMFCTKGIKTTAASKMLSNFTPPYDATVVERLKSAGALVLGKLNQDEFAMGSSNETSFYGPAYNPWNLEYVPGGSSGGSAAAMASKSCLVTLGTDTGGSIRQPSHFCGLVGVKPTYGRVSRYGIVAFASSLDQAGPMASTVTDAALILESMCGQDAKDQTSSDQKVAPWSKKLSAQVKGKKIGIIKEYWETSGLSEDVKQVTQNAYDYLKAEGAELVDLSIPLTEHAVAIYYLVASSEASSNLSRYDGVRYGHRANFENLSGINLDLFYSKNRGEGFGSEVKTRIMLGTYCLSAGYYDAYYKKASQVRRLLQEQFLNAFSKCDAIVSPVSTTPAFKLGHRIMNPLQMYLNDIFTVSANLVGIPAMTVPYGLSTDGSGLPIGVQIMSKHFDEQTMLDIGFALESASTMKGKFAHV